MLWGGDKLEKIRNLLQQRAQAYANADLIVDASGNIIGGTVLFAVISYAQVMKEI